MTLDFARRHLYLCTPWRDDMRSFLPAVIRGGVDVVQLRDKQLSASEQLPLAKEMKGICQDWGVPFIINDRPELAFDLSADGVHVGQDDVSVDQCRRLLGPEAIIGLSTHSTQEFDRALLEPVSYLSAGPINATPTKPGRAATGAEYAELSQARSHLPVFVTGGVTPGIIVELGSRGLRHFVVVRYLTESTTPEESARSLRAEIDLLLA